MIHGSARRRLVPALLLALLAGAGPGLADGVAKPAPAKPRVAPSPPFTRAEDEAAVVPGAGAVRFFADDVDAFRKALPETVGPWLVLSGGGSDAAFGAGLLTGWAEGGDLPTFRVVTGASSGALIGVYAFLGPRYAARLRDDFVAVTSADIFELGATPDSLLDTWPLKAMLDRQVTPALLADVAAERAKGRRLFVVTTNLDAERPMVWDMGAIAALGDKGRALFRDVLLATSAIPGLFPPVRVKVAAGAKTFLETHGDGSTAAPFFLAPASMLLDPAAPALPASEVYVVEHSRLGPSFEQVERNAISVIGRSISVSVKAAARAEIALVSDWARRSRVPTFVAVITDAFDHPYRGAFDPDYTAALFALGRASGLNERRFTRVGGPEMSGPGPTPPSTP